MLLWTRSPNVLEATKRQAWKDRAVARLRVVRSLKRKKILLLLQQKFPCTHSHLSGAMSAAMTQANVPNPPLLNRTNRHKAATGSHPAA